MKHVFLTALCAAFTAQMAQAQLNSTSAPTLAPTSAPTLDPTTLSPTFSPSSQPTDSPTALPTTGDLGVQAIPAEALGISVLTYLGVIMVFGWAIFEGLRVCPPTSYVYTTRFRMPETSNPLETEKNGCFLGWVCSSDFVSYVFLL